MSIQLVPGISSTKHYQQTWECFASIVFEKDPIIIRKTRNIWKEQRTKSYAHTHTHIYIYICIIYTQYLHVHMYTVYNITTRMPFFNPSQQFPNWDTTTSPRLSVQDVLHQMSSRKPSFRRAERQLLCQENVFKKKNNNFPDFLQGFITKRDDLKKNPGTIIFRGGGGWETPLRFCAT